jgi:hypothetical protein
MNMRLWSIHPGYLDAKGLAALWREGLLAQKVLCGDTKGYRYHPQLIRFKDAVNPLGAIAVYLRYVAAEAKNRGYNFDESKIANKRFRGTMTVTNGQLKYEFMHLLDKLKIRAPKSYVRLAAVANIEPHPLFDKVAGGVEAWEVVRFKSD